MLSLVTIRLLDIEPEFPKQMQSHGLARLMIAAAAAVAPISLSAVVAATPAEVHPGMQVFDPSGGVVGTVTATNGANLVLKTAKHEVQLPMASFTANQGKLLFGMTAAQLDAAAEEQAAVSSADIVAGAPVLGCDGTVAGTVDSVDEQTVTIKLASGQIVRVGRNTVSGRDNGVVLAVSTAKINEMAAEAIPQAAQADGQ
jgi:preprotein translocase subunit YajC